MFVPLGGFSPDLDPTTPGILTDCSAIVPTLRGIAAAAGARSAGLSALAATCLGLGQIRKLDDSTRLFAGTQTALFEISGTTWTDRTRAVGGAYTGSTNDRWRFAQYGNVSFAANGVDTLQSSSSGAFANVSGAPAGAIVETVGEFVFLFDTNEGTFGDSPDRWWCSAIGDPTNWTPSIANQCATNRLTAIPGRILAGRRLGERIVVYKDRGISVGTYTGPAFVWSWADIPGDIGAISQEVVVSLETMHFFMSVDGFFSFDGVSVTPIDNDIRNWWMARVNRTDIRKSLALHNRNKGSITWFYPSASSMITEGVVYNYRTNKWGIDNRTIEATVEYVQASTTYDNLGSSYSTYQDLPTNEYDSSIFAAGSDEPAIMDTAHTLYTLTGTPGAWSFTTSEFGDDQQFSFLARVIPKFITAPGSATLTNSYRNATNAALTIGQTTALSRGRFDVYRSARWHTGTIAGTGAMEMSGLNIAVEEDGSE